MTAREGVDAEASPETETAVAGEERGRESCVRTVTQKSERMVWVLWLVSRHGGAGRLDRTYPCLKFRVSFRTFLPRLRQEKCEKRASR